MSSRYRVVQWATGNTGQRAMREVIRHPSLDLVGVLVYNPEKNGVDAGKLCGEGPTGVKATTDRDAVLKLKADCCIYMPRATGRGQTRAGLTEDQVTDDLEALLGSGTNIVSTCTDLFAGGVRMNDKNRARLLAACKRGNSSVWTSGSDPGFITETLPMALLSIQRRVDLIEIEEFGDLSRRPSAHMVMEQMRFGKPLAEFDPRASQESSVRRVSTAAECVGGCCRLQDRRVDRRRRGRGRQARPDDRRRPDQERHRRRAAHHHHRS